MKWINAGRRMVEGWVRRMPCCQTEAMFRRSSGRSMKAIVALFPVVLLETITGKPVLPESEEV